MELIAKDHSSEAGHWYTRGGDPMYTVMGKSTGKLRNTTLRDARELDLVPSVSGIINVAAKPALTVWLQEQAILAALTLPRQDGEPEYLWLKRVLSDSKQQGRDAADLGTEIHAAIQGFYEGRTASKYPHHVDSCKKAIEAFYGARSWVCEKSFSHELGFGGKCDMFNADGDGIVIDIKTKDFKDLSKPLAYDEHMLQLAAYRAGLGLPSAKCANVFVSRTNPDLAHVHEWAEDDIKKGWAMFQNLLNYWQLKNNHE
jgi:hypothetical protein